jgi:hypothetical protein
VGFEALEVHYWTRPVPGVAEKETTALLKAVDEYREFVREHRAILSDSWQDAALRLEQEKAVSEIRERGEVDESRPNVFDEWARERPRLLARLEVMRDEINRLDRIATAAIREQAPAEVGPATQRARDALVAYEDAINALARAAADAKAALTHANNVQTIVRTGSHSRAGASFGIHVFGGREDTAVNHAREALANARKYAARVLNGGVRYVPGQTVTFITAGGRQVTKTIDAHGADRLNAGDLDSVRLLLALDKTAVPVMEVGLDG